MSMLQRFTKYYIKSCYMINILKYAYCDAIYIIFCLRTNHPHNIFNLLADFNIHIYFLNKSCGTVSVSVIL